MKTDDDSFVRVDEVLASLHRTNISHGLLYGLINYDAQPHRNPNSKWYISIEVTFCATPADFIRLINTAELDWWCNHDN